MMSFTTLPFVFPQKENEKNSKAAAALLPPPQTPALIITTRRRRNNCANICVFLTALLVLIIGVIGGIYLYKHLTHRVSTDRVTDQKLTELLSHRCSSFCCSSRSCLYLEPKGTFQCLIQGVENWLNSVISTTLNCHAGTQKSGQKVFMYLQHF